MVLTNAERQARFQKRQKVRASLRLYVWHDVPGEYTPGVMFALASSLEEAIKVIGAAYPAAEYDLVKPHVVYADPVGFAVWG